MAATCLATVQAAPSNQKKGARAPALADADLVVKPAVEKLSTPVKLESVRFEAEHRKALLVYSAPPGLSLCVYMTTTNGASFAPSPLAGKGPGMGRVQESDRSRCVIADKAGKALASDHFHQLGGMLLSSIVLVSQEVHTDVIPLPAEPTIR